MAQMKITNMAKMMETIVFAKVIETIKTKQTIRTMMTVRTTATMAFDNTKHINTNHREHSENYATNKFAGPLNMKDKKCWLFSKDVVPPLPPTVDLRGCNLPGQTLPSLHWRSEKTL